MTWTSEIRYFILPHVKNHFQIPFIVSPIVCIYMSKILYALVGYDL